MTPFSSPLKRTVASLLMLAALALPLASCSKGAKTTEQGASPSSPSLSVESGKDTTSKGEESMYGSSNYVNKYADTAAMDEWLSENVEGKTSPPVTFRVGGKSSADYVWQKTVGQKKQVIYFEEEMPSESIHLPITYRCPDLSLRGELTLISYTGYPVVEYTATLYNDGEGNSKAVSNLLSADYPVESKQGTKTLHASRGATTTYTDFEPLSYQLDGRKYFEVTNGKPTSTYIPYFNLENKEQNTGTIAILNWQGNWKAEFTPAKEGAVLKAGQHTVNVVLQKGESLDFPGMVLLFYKGDRMNGQNVYRRWLYCCNQFREQGKKMKETNVLVCPAEYNINSNKRTIALYVKTGLIDYIDKFNIDGGWYDTEGKTWYHTGNWYTVKRDYPQGIKQLSKLVHDEGLQFAVWFEPERVAWGTATTEALKAMKGLLLPPAAGKTATDYSTVPDGYTEVILDYSNPEVVQWVIDLLNTRFEENDIDQYRQDFNTSPAAQWSALDRTRKAELGISRIGYTENKYCKGYLDVYAGILAENPRMYIDACASGGMRNDLSTIRYSFMHTRSDYWADIESAQLQTYGSSMWFMYWGTGFSSADCNDYDVRSHIGNSIGVGISNESQAQNLKDALTEWKHFAGYLFYDYYPLSDYVGSTKKTMALQYDSPEQGMGLLITYFRKNDTFTLRPEGLDPKALYEVWDFDDKKGSLKTMTGEELMAGIRITSTASTAIVYEYKLAEGQDTTAFQTEKVPTGKGWGGYDPDGGKDDKEELTDVTIPTVTTPYENPMADERLGALYDLKEANTVKLLTADYRTTGLVYAISKDIYDELIFTDYEADGWKAINEGALFVSADGKNFYPFTTWDGNGSLFKNVEPFAKKIGNGYFLWLANLLPFADGDGGWKSSEGALKWNNKSAGLGQSALTLDFSESGGRIVSAGSDGFEKNGTVYKIDKAIFESFAYTGKGVKKGEVTLYQIDSSKVGLVSVQEKAPREGSDLSAMTTWFSRLSGDEVGVYGYEQAGVYYLLIENSAAVEALSVCTAQSPRALLVWKDRGDSLCVQSMRFPA